MSSNTNEDLTNISKENVSTLKFPVNSIKRKPRVRNYVNITPLRLKELEKELKEAENEPLPCLKYKPDDDEEDEDVETVDNDEATLEIIQYSNDNCAKDKSLVNDSFNMGFAALSMVTPAKTQLVPYINGTRSISNSSTNKLLYSKDNQYITPQNKMCPPKVLCSVKMDKYLKPPCSSVKNSNTVQRSVSESVKRTADSIRRKVEFAELQSNPADLCLKKINVNNVEYVILNELGKGGTSQVYHGFNVAKRIHRAIKQVSLKNPASAESYINEVKVLQRLQCCNRIVKMYDYEIVQSESVLLVVLEVGGADLSKILKELAASKTHLPMYMLIYYWMEMLYAVKQIHTNGIIHSDLKPANFLKAERCLKLIDFGISSCIQNDMTSVIKTVPEGTFNYISPEALKSDSSTNEYSPTFDKLKFKISYKSDVWSLGCILYQLVYKRTPFQHLTQPWTKLATIADPNHKIEYHETNWAPSKIIKTIKSCLQYNMKQRPSIDELIADYENIFYQE